MAGIGADATDAGLARLAGLALGFGFGLAASGQHPVSSFCSIGHLWLQYCALTRTGPNAAPASRNKEKRRILMARILAAFNACLRYDEGQSFAMGN